MTTETRVPLLPESGLYARVDDPDVAERFVRLFRAAFTWIPDYARTVLLEYWRKRQELMRWLWQNCFPGLADFESTGPDDFEMPAWPRLIVSNDWAGRSPGSLSDYDSPAADLAFHLGAFRLMPDQVAAILIARELCRTLFLVEDKYFASDEADEQEVNHTLESWGFETQMLTDWARNTRGALRGAGADRCGCCGERDVPEEQPSLLETRRGWEPVCSECFAEQEGLPAVYATLEATDYSYPERAIINGPPEDQRCQCCSRHSSELQPFGGNPRSRLGNLATALLVKRFRSYEGCVYASWECRDCFNLSTDDYHRVQAQQWRDTAEEPDGRELTE